MIEIQNFNVYAKNMTCYVVHGEPWFRADDNASILDYNDTKKALANNVGNDEKKELAYFLDHKARVDLTSPWTIIRIIQYKSMNQVFMH